ncbi:hypothetical protein CAOG_03767 [Capsaspora owczarzaki ATCC 30864]|uniref:hypothetical protein n=1 Tax=Capsaspora owczarzaki (strain ATCC 30864) TaxID=595528 RepID=UPI0003526D98|nr:hypothetical protein CAOG_03767 [Capsaspora owczarzaki ATCC 30864]|eukprot:XP_004363495.2 hypothetical protein CAOG_03767 [Capsaspora owczarzaki ATCC 30864]
MAQPSRDPSDVFDRLAGLFHDLADMVRETVADGAAPGMPVAVAVAAPPPLTLPHASELLTLDGARTAAKYVAVQGQTALRAIPGYPSSVVAAASTGAAAVAAAGLGALWWKSSFGDPSHAAPPRRWFWSSPTNPSLANGVNGTTTTTAPLNQGGHETLAGGAAFDEVAMRRKRRLAKTSNDPYVPGTKNIDGNSCYINALMQAFASVGKLHEFLCAHADNARILGHGGQLPLVVGVADFLDALNERQPSSNSKPLAAYTVLDPLCAKYGMLNGRQQDLHELFQFVSSTLTDELAAMQHASKRTLSIDKNLAIPSRSCLSFASPMIGLVATQLVCSACGHEGSLRLDPFDNISLPLYAVDSFSPSLLDCLAAHFSTQPLEGIKCDNCYDRAVPLSWQSSASNTPSKAGKVSLAAMAAAQGRRWQPTLRGRGSLHVALAKLPPVFAIHLSRLVYTDSGNVKADKHVRFPMVLDLAPFAYLEQQHNAIATMGPEPLARLIRAATRSTEAGSTAQSSTSSDRNAYRYKLSAVVVHLGGGSGGHFVTYRKIKRVYRVPAAVAAADTPSSVNASVSSEGTESSLPAGGAAQEADLVKEATAVSDASSSATSAEPSTVIKEHWLHCSDDVVRMATTHEVLSSQAYMLFYERVGAASSSTISAGIQHASKL